MITNNRIKPTDLEGVSRIDLLLIYLSVWGKVHRVNFLGRAVSKIAPVFLLFPYPVPKRSR